MDNRRVLDTVEDMVLRQELEQRLGDQPVREPEEGMEPKLVLVQLPAELCAAQVRRQLEQNFVRKVVVLEQD